MKLLRFDMTGGAGGDMILGALLALGADGAAIEAALQTLLGQPVHLHLEPADSHGIHGHRLDVHARHGGEHPEEWGETGHHHHGHGHDHGHHHGHAHEHRSWREIDAMLSAAAFSETARARCRAVFEAIARAEAEVHGKPPDEIHFHEVGAWDSIADIVGACLALEQLGVGAVEASPFPCGVGTLACAHGIMPNPAPATLRLLQSCETTQTDEPFELVTPTGAALLSVLPRLMPAPRGTRTVVRDAFSFGRHRLQNRPNLLRATLFETTQTAMPAMDEALVLLETNLDDCNPQWLPELMQRLLDAGANDAWVTPVIMKKGRPGMVLSVLANEETADKLLPVVFRATTTFGIRGTRVGRATLGRRMEEVATRFGTVRVKVGTLGGEDITRTPEFEDCARFAREHNVAPRDVADAARG